MRYLAVFLESPSCLILMLISILSFSAILLKNKRLDDICVISIFLWSGLLLGLRNDYSGTDTQQYKYFFYLIEHDQDIIGFSLEPLFVFFVKFLSYILNWPAFLFLTVLLQLLPFYYLSRKFFRTGNAFLLISYISLYPGFDLLTNGIRQGLALSLFSGFFVGYVFRGGWRNIFMGALAGFFHKSMFLWVVLWITPRKILEARRVISVIASILFTILTFWLSSAGDGLTSIFDMLSFSIVGTGLTVGEKLAVYSEDSSDMVSGIFKIYFLLISLMPIGLYYICRLINKTDTPPKASALVMMYLLLLTPYILLWTGAYSYRFLYVAYPLGVIISSFLLKNTRSLPLRWCYFLFIIASQVMTYGGQSFSGFRYNWI